METKVSLVVPLSGATDSFALTGACACCGKPGEHVWEYHTTYQHKRWEQGQKGPTLVGFKNADGTEAVGEVEMKIFYCDEHYKQTKRLRRLQKTMSWVMGLGTAAFTIWVFTRLSLDRFSESTTTGQAGFWLCASPIIAALASGFVLMLITQGIQSQMSSWPQNAEFPLEGFDGGGSGVGIATRVAGGTPGRGTVRYFLDLDFLNPDTARQFKASYPSAAVKKGQELLEG